MILIVSLRSGLGRREIKDILLSLVQEKPENRPDSLENAIVSFGAV